MELSKLILSTLFNNTNYGKKVLPYLKKDYFTSFEEGYLFKLYKSYVIKHHSFPSEVSIKIELSDSKDLNEKAYKDVLELLDLVLNYDNDCDIDWLIDKTENWCKERAIFLALCKSIEIHDKRGNIDAIPEILRGALQISFDSSCGIEVFDEKDMISRMKNYKKKIKKFSTGITKLDIITDGGFESKSISVFFGGSGTGKSATLVAISANMCRDGEDVLYVTLEMAEDKISQRYEANFLNEHINSIKNINEDSFKDKLLNIKKNHAGRLVIKEYPTATITTEHIRALLDELEIKKNFKPTVLVVDYINLMRSSRFSGDNMYSTVKSITEELRGLAIEKELCLISATQANKEGNSSKNTDLDVTNVGECLSLNSMVKNEKGELIPIKYVKVGDKLVGHNKIVDVVNVFPIKKKPMYKITTKNGKEIICSGDHSFPTDEGYKKIYGTLKVGSKIKTT